MYVLVEGIAAQDRQGQGRRCRAAVIDVTQQKRADELAAANQALQAEIAARKQAEEHAAAGQGRRRGRQRGQEPVPGQYEPRTPHAHECHPGHDRRGPAQGADPTVQDCLQTAQGSADLLLALLNDLLDSAKIESGKLELESAPFSLRRMLDQITRVLSMRASEHGLCFSCRMPEETPDVVVGDRMKLQQVLLNLAGNAIKFTEHGEVEVSVCACERPRLGEGPG